MLYAILLQFSHHDHNNNLNIDIHRDFTQLLLLHACMKIGILGIMGP